MSLPPIPPTLGKPVTWRTFDWRQMAIAAWGEEWGKNDIAYEWPSGSDFQSTDRYITGIYRPKGWTGP